MIYVATTLTAKICISQVLKKKSRSSLAIKTAEKSQQREHGLPMRKLVLAVAIFAVIIVVRVLDGFQFVDSKSRKISLSALTSSVVMNCILFYFVSSPKIVKYLKRRFFVRNIPLGLQGLYP
jgi:p-aminobenzoyl-glutamate transporter AbgT